VSAQVPTESDLDSIDYSDTYERTFTENGVANTLSRSTGNVLRDTYGVDAISACVGGNGVHAPDSLKAVWTTMLSSLMPFSIDASTRFSPIRTITDEEALYHYNDFGTPACCRFMPADGLFVDAGGYEITREVTRNLSAASGGEIAFLIRDYALNISRTLTITGIRGRASDGSLVELLNNPLP
jgi:hypothetical protein